MNAIAIIGADMAGLAAMRPAPDGPVAQVIDQSDRPGAAAGASAAPDWSRERLDRPTEEIAGLLARHLGLDPPHQAVAHRWRFARIRVPLGRPYLACGGGLLAGGDWALGPDAGAAWASGRAMVDALLG